MTNRLHHGLPLRQFTLTPDLRNIKFVVREPLAGNPEIKSSFSSVASVENASHGLLHGLFFPALSVGVDVIAIEKWFFSFVHIDLQDDI